MDHTSTCPVCLNARDFCECSAPRSRWPQARISPPKAFHPYAGHEKAQSTWPPVLPRQWPSVPVPPAPAPEASPSLSSVPSQHEEAGLTGAEKTPAPLPGSQSPRLSALEAALNVIFGFIVSVLANWLILPFYGVSPRLSVSAEIGIWFTIISFARSYLIRRLFNKIHSLEE